MYLVEQSHCDKISEDASQGDQGLNTDLTMVGQKRKATSPCVSLHCGHGATSSEEYFAERFVSLSSATCFASWHIRLVVPGSMIFAIQQPRRGVWLTAGTLLSHQFQAASLIAAWLVSPVINTSCSVPMSQSYYQTFSKMLRMPWSHDITDHQSSRTAPCHWVWLAFSLWLDSWRWQWQKKSILLHLIPKHFRGCHEAMIIPISSNNHVPIFSTIIPP